MKTALKLCVLALVIYVYSHVDLIHPTTQEFENMLPGESWSNLTGIVIFVTWQSFIACAMFWKEIKPYVNYVPIVIIAIVFVVYQLFGTTWVMYVPAKKPKGAILLFNFYNKSDTTVKYQTHLRHDCDSSCDHE